MFRRNNKTRKYLAPSVKVTQMALESNFCNTVIVNGQSDALHNINADMEDQVKGVKGSDPLYFEF